MDMKIISFIPGAEDYFKEFAEKVVDNALWKSCFITKQEYFQKYQKEEKI
jgi:hypothetical protein